jgi:hypothetical protein
MAKNDLTAAQDILTREFLTRVALADNTLSVNPSLKRQLHAICLELLGYERLADGRFISKGKNVTMPYGQQPSMEDYPNEWNEDYEAAVQRLEKEAAAAKAAGKDKANRGKSSKSTKIWQAVLSENL